MLKNLNSIPEKLLIQFATFGGPVLTIPQLWSVYIERQTAGISTVSWTAYALISAIWTVYAFKNKDRPLFLNSIIYLIQCAAVAIGVGLTK
ncbi:MAG: hypothetical protein OHK0017_01650 [Patescibacteria group bacterium]